MKSKEEIERLATKHYRSNGSGGGQYTEGLQEGRLIGYVDGYTQCQEDMADYIFEVAKEFHRLGKYSGQTSDTHFVDVYEETINSLNKKD